MAFPRAPHIHPAHLKDEPSSVILGDSSDPSTHQDRNTGGVAVESDGKNQKLIRILTELNRISEANNILMLKSINQHCATAELKTQVQELENVLAKYADEKETIELIKATYDRPYKSGEDNEDQVTGDQSGAGMNWAVDTGPKATNSLPRPTSVVERRLRRRKKDRKVRRQAQELKRAMEKMGLGK